MVAELFRDIGGTAAKEGSFLESVLDGVGQAVGFVVTALMVGLDVLTMLIQGTIFGIINLGMIINAVLGTVVDFFTFLGSVVAGFFTQLASWVVFAVGTFVQFTEAGIGLFVFLFSNIMAGLAAVGNFFIEVWNGIAENVIVPFINFFIEAWNMVGESFYAIFNGIASFFAATWNFLVENVVIPVAEAFITAFDAVGEFFFNLWNGISAGFFDIIGGIVGGFQSMVDFFLSGINAIIGAISSVSEVLGLGTIGEVGKVDLGSQDFAAKASATRGQSYQSVAGDGIAAALGDSLKTTFEPAVFQAAKSLDGAALNITDRFDDSGKSFAEAQAEAAGALGSDAIMASAQAMGDTATQLAATPIMSDDTANQWQGVANEWNKSFEVSGDSADKAKEATKAEKSVAEKDTRGGEKTADHLKNIEKQNEAAGKAAGKGTRISNADEIKPNKGDLSTTINFNQNIDTQKKREQFVLDNTLRSYALVV